MLQNSISSKPTKPEVKRHVDWYFINKMLIVATGKIINYLFSVQKKLKPQPKPDPLLVKLGNFNYRQPLPKYDNMRYVNCMLLQVRPNTVVDFGGKPVTLDGGNWVNCAKFPSNVKILNRGNTCQFDLCTNIHVNAPKTKCKEFCVHYKGDDPQGNHIYEDTFISNKPT